MEKHSGQNKIKVVVVMPAYNAEKTLEKTYKDIPKEYTNSEIFDRRKG